MANTVWSAPADVPLLQWLVRGPLKQHLPQSARLWVWLHLFYGGEQQRLALPETFTYADCRSAFFTASHPTGDRKPQAHDPNCPCQKSLATWLFLSELTGSQQARLAHNSQGIEATQDWSEDWRQNWQQALAQAGELPEDIEQLLTECRPFAMTRRALASDLKRLCELGWLQHASAGYRRVSHWPNYPAAPAVRDIAFLT
ncbi:MAG: hypothetical protein AAFN68_13900 [Pseudomonadota bacterium]